MQLYRIFFIIALALLGCTPRNNQGNKALLPIKVNCKIGYINQNGKIIITPKFDDGSFFSEGLAIIWDKDRCGYIDTTGTIVIPPKYQLAKPFIDGMALVGRVVVKENIHFESSLSKWQYEMENGFWGIIDKTGKQILPMEYQRLWHVGCGLYSYTKGQKTGLINVKDKIVLPPIYDWEITGFNEGMAEITRDGKQGFIDTTGKIAIKPQYQSISEFSEGMAAVKTGAKWGYIDKKGNFIIAPKYEEATPFYKGLARVKVTGKYGCITRDGKYKIEPVSDYGISLYWDLAPVEVKDKWGYVDRKGKLAIPVQYDYATDFFKNFATVRIGHYYGLIDTTGKYRIEPKYGDAIQLSNLIWIRKNKWGALDYTLQLVLPIQYDHIIPLSTVDDNRIDEAQNYMKVCVKQQGYGLVDSSGRVIIYTKYDDLKMVANDIIIAYVEDRIGYFTTSGKCIWSPTK